MKVPASMNVMPDLATAMKQNPNLKVQLNGGYFDLATPFFAAQWELQHCRCNSRYRPIRKRTSIRPATWCMPMSPT